MKLRFDCSNDMNYVVAWKNRKKMSFNILYIAPPIFSNGHKYVVIMTYFYDSVDDILNLWNKYNTIWFYKIYSKNKVIEYYGE